MPNMYCPICERTHHIVQRIKVQYFTHKGKILKYKKRVYMCRNTPKGAEFFEDGQMVNENLENMRKAIKESGL